MRRSMVPMLVLALAAGCAHASSQQKLASAVTEAVYHNDISPVADDFNALIRPQLTRASVGALSDKMHARGDFQGLDQVQDDSKAQIYGYTAKFSQGSMLVCMKLDGDGKIAAYRAEPLDQGKGPTPSTSNPCSSLE